jgi:hypothetical protein
MRRKDVPALANLGMRDMRYGSMQFMAFSEGSKRVCLVIVLRLRQWLYGLTNSGVVDPRGDVER